MGMVQQSSHTHLLQSLFQFANFLLSIPSFFIKIIPDALNLAFEGKKYHILAIRKSVFLKNCYFKL